MDQYKDLNRQCKKSARQDKQNWAESKAIQGEAYLVTAQIKDAFAHFRNFRAACPRKVSPILGDHGNLISDKAAKAHRWKNYFEQLLNHPSVPCPDLPSTVQEKKTSMPVKNHLSWKSVASFWHTVKWSKVGSHLDELG